MSSDPPPEAPTPKRPPASSMLSALDSPSSYLNASKKEKAAIKAAYSEIFRIPKKKRKSDATDTNDKGGAKLPSPKKKKAEKGSPKRKLKNDAEFTRPPPSPEKNASPTKTNHEDPISILRKGDLVRLDSEQTRSGRIQGGLARVTKIHPPTTDSEKKSEYSYDIEYVLGGKVSNVTRVELIHTTAEAEGLVATNLRERRSNRALTKEEDNAPKKSVANKRKRDYTNKRPSSKDGSVSSRSSRQAPTKKPTKEAIKAPPKRNSRRTSTDDDSSDAGNTTSNALDLYTRHKRELERSLARLEKVDRFGFFFDTCPPEFDENYDDAGEATSFPDGPPFNFVVLKKRFEAGRYDVDFVQVEMERRKGIKATFKENVDDTATMEAISEEADSMNNDESLIRDEAVKTLYHPVGVDWDTFNKDVVGMCDAAIERDPDGKELGSGHLGWSANKIKKLMEEMYTNYGCKRRAEMELSEARLKYENILNNCGNREAAMQGRWRKHAFPERKYERLETSSVICDGLSELDKSYAIYELGTSISDSFVGLAYTYDDSGQHSETWMKTVVDETTAKPKARRKKKNIDESTDVNEQDKNKEHTAAAALAKDDGVTKAQVQNTMQSLLIQVQDKVMTDLGVMNQPEARSANWDDGDDRRNYRGGAAEVEQGSNINSLPEVAEQEVWGVDCYTRKNIMALIESEFSADIALEFMEKWLLPAINACPVNLAYDISTAARILEGLPIINTDVNKEEVLKPEESQSDSKVNNIEAQLETIKSDILPDSPRRKAPESSVFLRNALESKIKNSGPPWLKAAAQLIRLAADSLDEDDGFFRIHPKGHGSVVIGEHGLKANSLVTYYRGEVYPAWRWCEKLDAIEKTQKDLDLRPNLPDFYNMAMERPKKDPRGYGILFVDATRKSGLGSSFSHSCNPSCEVRVVALNGKLSLAMTTIRDLEQGEELTFDYNAVTESFNEYRFAICLCGHRNCRGSFLHLTSAPCYQQVLSRNCPMASRFANLVRGCMKQVMSREDSDILLKHGFNTASFGAVSFNHHSKANCVSPRSITNRSSIKDARTQLGELLLEFSSPPRTSSNKSLASENKSDAIEQVVSSNNVIPDSSEDSIENVPIWLRTYVADTLRYIEYERRALPVALLCNQMERIEQQKAKEKREKRNNKKPDKVTPAESDLSKPKSKPISGSKPKSSYFFYLNSNRDEFLSIVERENRGKLKGLELSQAVNKYGSQAWSNLTDEEKQSWKDKAIDDWKKNGGQEKAKLEEDRQRANGVNIVSEEIAPSENTDVVVEQKVISFADAEAEGLSAMEQRIQQLAQSLSRVGRVLDRHRESEYRKIKGATVNPRLLRSLVPSPLKIMSDEEVVNWMWNDSTGVVHSLFAIIHQHFPESSLLRKLISSTRATYPVLSAFTAFSTGIMHPSVEQKKGKNACSSADARKLVREALLEFRADINDFLALAEKSHSNAIKQKKAEAARCRELEKKAKKNIKQKTTKAKSDKGEGETVTTDVTSSDPEGDDVAQQLTDSQHIEDHEMKEETPSTASYKSDNAMRIRGGGGNIESNTSENAPEVKNDFASNDATQSLMIKDGFSKPNVDAMSKTVDHSQAKSRTLSAISSDVPTEKSISNAINLGSYMLPKCTNPPSSTESQGETKLASSPVTRDAPNDDLRKSQSNDGASDGSEIEKIEATGPDTNIKPDNAPLEALALMADLAAAVPLVTEQRQPNMNQHEAGKENSSTATSTALPNPSLLPEATVNDLSQEMKEDMTVKTIPAVTTEVSESLIEPQQEPKKKKTVPMNPEQLAYLKKWLLDPNHILNPYPTEAEKGKIMKDIGVEQTHLERWLQRQRKATILSPVKPRVEMKWQTEDASHWADFRSQRYMLEATADLLLMYASTNTFFLLESFNRFDSTPIEVYARELGNDVPRHYKTSYNSVDTGTVHENTSKNEASVTAIAESVPDNTTKYCSPEDVITSVTVSYSGEYVISQLLQWFNGGIGQPQGLPDIFGCVMLPPVFGCWDEVKGCIEIKPPTSSRNDSRTATEYSTKIRLHLADWIDDRNKRGSPWNEAIAQYFCRAGSQPDPSMPMGSPVIDYLVTGIEENIQFVSSSLRDKDGKGIDSPARSRSKASASDRLQSTVDAGMPAQAVANWVQCENPICLKWRKLPWHVDIDLLPEKFYCKDNIWTSGKRSCDVPEDKWDMSDAPVKFDTAEEDFAVGVWFDVQRDGKVGYHEAQVVEMDFNSAVKRVKFHFWRLSNASDEWIEIGSPKIAPHHSYTPRPVDGYRASSNSKKKGSTANTVSKPPTEKSSESAESPSKSKLDDVAILPPPVSTIKALNQIKTPKKFVPFPKATVDYLSTWFEKHAENPFPTQEEKLIIMATTGLNKRQLSDWLAKARKKHKKQVDSQDKQNITVPKTDAKAEKLEDLLLQLKRTLPVAGESSGHAKTTVDKPSISSNAPILPFPSKHIGLSEDAKCYLWKWVQAHKLNPFPTKEEKDKMISDLNLRQEDVRKLEGWFSRARKRIKTDSNPSQGFVSHSTGDHLQSFQSKQMHSLSDGKSLEGKISSTDVDTYLQAWLSRPENITNFNPNQETREQMKAESGIEPKRIESWFYRFRKKMKKHHDAVNGSSQQSAVSIPKSTPFIGVAQTARLIPTVIKSAPSNPARSSTIQPPSQPNQNKNTQSVASGSSNPSQTACLIPTAIKSAPSNPAHSSTIQSSLQPNQNQNAQLTASGSSNLDLLFEAASIHSAAKEAQSKIENKVIDPQTIKSNGSNANMLQGASRFAQENPRRSSPMFCQPIQSQAASSRGHTQENPRRSSPMFSQPIQSQAASSRGHTPPINSYSQPARDHQPTSFVPISSRGPTPTFNVHPPYPPNEQIHQNDQHPRPHSAYYPRPPNGQVPAYHQRMNNAQYHPYRYNMHNGQQQNGSQQHQR